MFVVCINLDRATERWERIRREVGNIGVDPAVVVRIPAVDGHKLSEAELRDALSPLSQWEFRRDATMACDELRIYDRILHGFRIDGGPHHRRILIHNPGAVGCTLSHRRAWQRLLDTPNVDAMVVLEDDACLDERLGPLLRRDPDGPLEPLFVAADRRRPGVPRWDLMILGYENHVLRGRKRRPVLWTNAGLAVCAPDATHVGSHAYAVTREGARRLLRWSLPIEIHVDYLLSELSMMNLVRGLLVQPSLSRQCNATLERGILHPGILHVNYKRYLPVVTVAQALGAALFVALGCAVILAWALVRSRRSL